MPAEILGIVIIAIGAYLICNLCKESTRRDEQWNQSFNQRRMQTTNRNNLSHTPPPSYDSLYPYPEVDSTQEPFPRGSMSNYLGAGFTSTFRAIADRFTDIKEVSRALKKAGLESSNLIFGIDFTASNDWQGENTFNGHCLHSMSTGQLNPYQQVISILGETLAPFDDDGLIPVFGFGDKSTRDKRVFPFKQDGLCFGVHEVLECYKQISQSVSLSGPTNFAPLIQQAVEIVKQTKSYHILVIIADGQVTSERATRAAIVEASNYALSIVMVGVGDGPWDMMKDFDEMLPRRQFDNFQFVDFHKIMQNSTSPTTAFSLHALMEIPDQFLAVRNLGFLDQDE
ncbi:uncharacterized protein LOC100369190 [Saccoglossus kowalevskii]|uniref:Copine family protein 2-like n=1 Tax=Saccoglossus kowalevskii TaxID=10224 RepID=A0ABM0GU14_SACKO|nr:PREDICTED: copine family protein 2-like [Saccoglossus kowalevskii]